MSLLGEWADEEAAVVRVMNYTLAEGHDDEVSVIRRLKECPTAQQPVRRSVRQSVRPSVRPSIHLSVRQCVRLSVRQAQLGSCSYCCEPFA